MGGFAPRSRTGIQDAISRLGIEQRCNRLRRTILHTPMALGITRPVAQIAAVA